MLTIPRQMESIYHDEEYYKKAFDFYMEISDRFGKWRDKMDSFFGNEVINMLEENVPRSVESLKILGVGCSAGDIDHDLASRLLTRYSKISNTVVEPTDAITEYKALVGEKPLPGVVWDWRQQTFEAYYQSILKPLEVPTFHFISAIAVLYHIQNWEAAVMNMYDLLDTDGVLMITLMSEESGFCRLWKRFPMLSGQFTVHINSNHVKEFLRTKKIDFKLIKETSCFDITCCSKDGDEEGSMLVDFFSHVKHFKTTASPQLQADFLDYLFSTKCSNKDKDRILFDRSSETIIVRKQ